MNRDAVFGGVTLTIAIVYYAMAAAIPESLLADAVGPQGLPESYAVVLAGLSLILIARATIRTSGLRREGLAAGFRPLGLLLIGILYVATVSWLGYVPSLAALIAATAYYQGGIVNRQVVLVAASGAVCFWLLFVVLLGISQPAGLWPALF